jgi:sec-independent protein translocase protein TatC
MSFKKYSFLEHFIELKKRIIYISFFYIISFGSSYWFSNKLINFLIFPLSKVAKSHSMIYTNLTEGFISHIRISAYFAFFLVIPFLILQIYQYLKPGLYQRERAILRIFSILSILVFYLGMIFVYYIVMPRAFAFFLSFESPDSYLPVKLFATINEYLTLTLHFMLVFGTIFEIPVILSILCLFQVISIESLTSKRKLVILVAFVLGGILTPPDVFSQFALAIPIILLYEISLLFLKFFTKKEACND